MAIVSKGAYYYDTVLGKDTEGGTIRLWLLGMVRNPGRQREMGNLTPTADPALKTMIQVKKGYLRVSYQICIWNVVCTQHWAKSDKGYKYGYDIVPVHWEFPWGVKSYTQMFLSFVANTDGKCRGE